MHPDASPIDFHSKHMAASAALAPFLQGKEWVPFPAEDALADAASVAEGRLGTEAVIFFGWMGSDH